MHLRNGWWDSVHRPRKYICDPDFSSRTPIFYAGGIFGSRCEMPLWQSMHVFCRLGRNVECACTARGLCRVKSM